MSISHSYFLDIWLYLEKEAPFKYSRDHLSTNKTSKFWELQPWDGQQNFPNTMNPQATQLMKSAFHYLFFEINNQITAEEVQVAASRRKSSSSGTHQMKTPLFPKQSSYKFNSALMSTYSYFTHFGQFCLIYITTSTSAKHSFSCSHTSACLAAMLFSRWLKIK